MKLKIAILSLTLTAAVFTAQPVKASASSEIEIGIGDQEKKKKKVQKNSPKRLSQARMDNASKRARNHQTVAISKQSRNKKYTRTLRPIETARFNPSDWGKKTKWVQKRIPKQKKDDVGQEPVQAVAEY